MPSHPRPRYRITDATRERTYAEVDGILPFAASHVFESLIGTRHCPPTEEEIHATLLDAGHEFSRWEVTDALAFLCARGFIERV